MGNAAYYAGGILLALIVILFLTNIFQATGLSRGLFMELLSHCSRIGYDSLNGGWRPFGIFYTDTGFPFLTTLAGLVMHLAYGIVLTLVLKTPVFLARNPNGYEQFLVDNKRYQRKYLYPIRSPEYSVASILFFAARYGQIRAKYKMVMR